MIVDTNIFIDYMRESEDAKQFLEKNSLLSTSVVVLSEMIYGFANKREVNKFEKLLDSLNIGILQISSEISEKGIDLFREHYFDKGVGFVDCIVAATALEADEPLVTLNVKHFRFIDGLDAVKPY